MFRAQGLETRRATSNIPKLQPYVHPPALQGVDFPIHRVQTKYQTQLVNPRMSQMWLDVGAPLNLTTVSSTRALAHEPIEGGCIHTRRMFHANVWRVKLRLG